MSCRAWTVRGSLLVAAAGALVLPATAAAALQIRSIDTRGYPLIRITVVAPRASTPEPTLTENGDPAQGFTATKLQGNSIVLAIDRSRSMRGKPLIQAANAARRFVVAKPADDRIAVLSFGPTAIALTPAFSTATIDADGALRGISVDTEEGTALYDAVVLGSNMLANEKSPVRILLLITDGRDISSQSSLEQATAAARAAGVSVYGIGIRGPQFTPGALRDIALQTGGGYYSATTANLTDVYRQIGAELRRTWILQYATAARAGDHVQLTVAAGEAGTITAGYDVPESSATPAAKAIESDNGWAKPAVLGILTGLVVFIALRLYQAVARRSRLRQRLGPYVESELTRRRQGIEPGRLLGLLAPLFRFTERTLGRLRVWEALERKLVRSDLPLRTVELFFAMLGAGLLLALISIASGSSPVLVLVLFVLGAVLPYLFVSIKADRRIKAFEAQLHGALTTLGASLTAGHSFTQALQALVESGQAPLSQEFARVLAEARLGRRIDAALTDMGARVGSKDLEFVVRAVVVQRQVGGSLAGLFDLVADTVDKRRQFRLRVKSLTAMGRLSAVVLATLPFGVALLITAVNYSYMEPLFTTAAGKVLIVVSALMIAFGSLILRRLVSFKA